MQKNSLNNWAVVVAQMVELLLPTTLVRSSNPIVDITYILSTVLKIQKLREKGRESPIF